MKIEKADLEKIAHLARLNFNEEDEGKMLQSINEIVEWVGKLEEVDTEGVEPLTHMSEEQNVLREDEVKNHLSREAGLKNAPRKDKQFIRVPKVLE
ncbi:Asp-tRNA(Asn)/Glu-tRNA(Gln) amidotransferase subunit GatC [Rapidithrix thailandica]|uniref:Aspartyl/glutamyl-tRNA(Asn/Gln) amidotransferase subunit C n=1 Tax=Rapidithrix thailandica TaxID=413964 RepID=A0AAW9S9I7_9BACT